jgi:hypothetical protein
VSTPDGLRLPLFDHATRLLAQHPDGPLPDGGRPRVHEQDAAQKRPVDLKALVQEFLTAGDTSAEALDILQEQLRAGAFRENSLLTGAVEAGVLHGAGSVRTTALELLRTSTERRAVWLALGLLRTCARHEDAGTIRTIGTVAWFTNAAVQALAAIEGTNQDLIWLAERSTRRARNKAISALCLRPDPTVRAWLLRAFLDERFTGPSLVREIAEALDLPTLLTQGGHGTHTARSHALRLMTAMIRPRASGNQIRRYPAARATYRALADHADEIFVSLTTCAALHSLLNDLRSGPSRLLDWDPGEREHLHDRFTTLLQQPPWRDLITTALTSPKETDRRRAEWMASMTDSTADAASGPGPAPVDAPHRLVIEIAVPDPALPGGVETRILANGRPVIAEAFEDGVGHSPDILLERGQLRAETEPREVQLAEADCTEGCCGALYVTIAREDDTVRWYGRRNPDKHPTDPAAPALAAELRFDATQYNAEVDRAQNDHSWESTGQTTARLLRRHFRNDPTILTRWNCSPNWISADHRDPDQVNVSFTFPGKPRTDPSSPWLQFIVDLPDDGTPPEQRADTDPTTYARVAGGSQEHAEALGFPWPPRR